MKFEHVSSFSAKDELEKVEDAFQHEVRVYQKLSTLLEDSWEKLKQHRESQGTMATALMLERNENTNNEYVHK